MNIIGKLFKFNPFFCFYLLNQDNHQNHQNLRWSLMFRIKRLTWGHCPEPLVQVYRLLVSNRIPKTKCMLGQKVDSIGKQGLILFYIWKQLEPAIYLIIWKGEISYAAEPCLWILLTLYESVKGGQLHTIQLIIGCIFIFI